MECVNQKNEFEKYLTEKSRLSEELCARCGACCGAFDGDPCVHLKKDGSNGYLCDTYFNRFGKQKTVTGAEFECVSIRDVLAAGWPKNPQCPYVIER